MMRKIPRLLLAFAVCVPAVAGADSPSEAEIESAWLAFNSARGEASLILGDVAHPTANEVFRVIPNVSGEFLDEAKLQLGFNLFHEARLSRDGSVACTTCHVALMGGVDRRPVSFGIGGAKGSLNAPTIFNAALNFRQFWDGRALTLQEQALGPIQNEVEFGHDLVGVVAVLESLPDYGNAFEAIYPDGITAANLGDAIAYYETMNFTGLASPFLRQFQEDQPSLGRQAQRGQQRFVEVGCASCHNGINLGGNSYQRLGVADPWFGDANPANASDDGLFGRTGREQDRHVFKVPTLHNVAYTGPWLHDGSITSLTQVVDQMARHQAGRYLENSDIDDIVAFLRTLGDSFAMLGDCSASGSYSVTMDCSMKQASAGALQDSAAAAQAAAKRALPEPAVLAQRHSEEYAQALNRAAAAPARIAEEMRRIRSGEVAHYDFLQFEHIEMLRYGRALGFPPASLEPDQRQTMLQQANQWQRSAQQYELIIADFLRNQAVASSAIANYQDLLRILSAGADEKTKLMLSQAEESVLAFYAQPNPETQRLLENSLAALSRTDLNPDRLKELQRQFTMLLESWGHSQLNNLAHLN